MDLEHIAKRAAVAYDWIVRSQTAKGQEGWMPLSAREVFKTDIPWLLAEVKRLQTRYQFAEPNNDCFVPRSHDWPESIRKLQQAAHWYGARFIPPDSTDQETP